MITPTAVGPKDNPGPPLVLTTEKLRNQVQLLRQHRRWKVRALQEAWPEASEQLDKLWPSPGHATHF